MEYFTTNLIAAMRARAPREYRQLVRTGQLNTYVSMVAKQAEEIYQQMLANLAKDEHGRVTDTNGRRCAEEYVTGMFTEFPDPETEMREPPDDLSPRRSAHRRRTSTSSQP